MEYLIRQYDHLRDADALIEIWLEALPDDFVSRLGAPYIAEIYIPELLSSRHSFGYVAVGSHGLMGFVLACNSQGLLQRVVLKNLRRFIQAWAINLIIAPIHTVTNTLSVAGYLLASLGGSNDACEAIEVCYIATNANCRGQGVGTALLNRLCVDVSIETSVQLLKAKTLRGKGPGRASLFYADNAFKIEKKIFNRILYVRTIR